MNKRLNFEGYEDKNLTFSLSFALKILKVMKTRLNFEKPLDISSGNLREVRLNSKEYVLRFL